MGTYIMLGQSDLWVMGVEGEDESEYISVL
jgi:hypothetical protein